MPTPSEHINQWKRNRKLLLSEALVDYPEWRITVAFYCALHAVEALLAARALPRFQDHAGRNRFLGDQGNKLLHIWHSYKPLFDASHDARYACPDAARRFPPAVQKQLIQACLQHIEGAVIAAIPVPRAEFPLIEVHATTGKITLKNLEAPETTP